ncbi:MAG: hypothetical protein HYV26_00620 [Candidatus Hydrogenedentes bacterium]|nr:hypothetical protein [Candidatus Hydrogenedentota bacterium]
MSKMRLIVSCIFAVAVAGLVLPANAADTSFDTDLKLNDSGSRTQIFMEGVEVLRVDAGSSFVFGDVANAGIPFSIRANGGDRVVVTAASTTLKNNLRIDNSTLRSQVFMEDHEVIRVDRGTAFLIGDIAGAGIACQLRTAGLTRLNIATDGSSAFSGDVTVDGETTTDVLQITGGADLAEQFEVQGAEAQPGMVVCIDPATPGHLMVSTKPYDKTVAGIISGANGLNPGMTMGQQGTIAAGGHPVALTGRVYCLVDATKEAVTPGDLLTTSSTPGHAMKASDHAQAMGAIIGKAMTPVAQGQKAMALVLVSLQ